MRRLFRIFKAFKNANSGVVLVELLLAAPVLLLFTLGLFELGNYFWQRQQVQVGVRDAARYLSRCNADATFCNYSDAQARARNLALYASPTVETTLRVPGWNDPTSIVITPSTLPTSPGPNDLITVAATTAYVGSPLFSLVGIPSLTISYSYSMRYIGW